MSLHKGEEKRRRRTLINSKCKIIIFSLGEKTPQPWAKYSNKVTEGGKILRLK